MSKVRVYDEVAVDAVFLAACAAGGAGAVRADGLGGAGCAFPGDGRWGAAGY